MSRPSLTAALIGERTSASRVEIAQGEQDELVLTAWHDDSVAARKVLLRTAGDYSCESGSVKITFHERRGEPVALWGVRFVAYLNRARDGSLVVRRDEVGGGVVFLIPFVGAGRIWARFNPW